MTNTDRLAQALRDYFAWKDARCPCCDEGDEDASCSCTDHNAWMDHAEKELRAEVAALTAQCEGLRKDAERYRWLRAFGHVNLCVVEKDMTLMFEEPLDAAIDSAIAAGNGEGV